VDLKLAVAGGVVGRGPAAQGLVMWLMRLDHHVICFFLSPSIKFKSVGVGGRSSADPLDFRRVYFEIFLLGCLIPACFGTTSRELRNFKYFLLAEERSRREVDWDASSLPISVYVRFLSVKVCQDTSLIHIRMLFLTERLDGLDES
jgi:hypothetical protein